MAILNDLPAELLWLIIDIYIPQHWNFLEDGEKYMEKRLVCKTFDALISAHAFKKLEFRLVNVITSQGTPIILRPNRRELNDDAVIWLLNERVLSDINEIPTAKRCSSREFHPQQPLLNNYCLSQPTNQRYIKHACTVAVAYQGRKAIYRQIEYSFKLWTPPNCNMLAVAAYFGDDAAVSELVRRGSKVNYSDGFLGPAIYAAAFAGKIDTVRLLFHYGANPNANGHLGSPLHAAAKHKNVPLVKLLLENINVDPNYPDPGGFTPLWKACFCGLSEVVQLLLSHKGTNISQQCGMFIHTTPLEVAIEQGHETIVKMFLARENTESDMKRALSTAISKGKTQLLQLLVQHWQINVGEYRIEGHTLLWRAVRAQEREVARIILTYDNVDPNAHSGDGNTPLWKAVEVGNDEIVKLLLQREDINPNIECFESGTPLWYAIFLGQESVIRLLVDCKAVDPNKGLEGETPLYHASRLDRWETVDLLVERADTDVNLQNRELATPAAAACMRGHTETLQSLLKRNDVNLHLKDISGRTPLIWAGSRGRDQIVKLILDYDITTLNKQDDDGKTCLMEAASIDHVHVVQLLLRYNADVNITDEQGWTALSWARWHQNPRIEALLLPLVRRYSSSSSSD